MQMTLKGSCRTAQGASPGKKHASSHLGNHPRSDPERVEQQRPRREPWRHGRPGCQPGKAEAACTALSGRTSGPATVPRACALGCPAGPLRGPFQFADPVCFLTADKTIHPQCQVCPAASALRGRPRLAGVTSYFLPMAASTSATVLGIPGPSTRAPSRVTRTLSSIRQPPKLRKASSLS